MSAGGIDIKIGARNVTYKAFSDVDKGLGRLGANVARVGSAMGNSLKAAGAQLTKLGAAMTSVGVVAGFMFTRAVQAFATFDDAMAAVLAKTSDARFGNNIDLLREKAKDLGATTRFSAGEAAQGMEMLAQAGFSTNKILSGIGPTLALAAAGGVDLKSAADIASDVAGGFHIAADEIGRVADVMAATATSANTDVLMMGETFKNVSAIAFTAGQDLEEISAAMGLLGNSSVKAGQAGTHLKIILQSMVNNRKAIEEGLGIPIEDANGKLRDLMDVMQDVGAATAKMSEADRLVKMTAIFGRGVASASILATALGTDVDAMRKKIKNSEGAAQEMADTMLSGLGGSIIKIKSAFEGLQIAIVETFQAELMQSAKGLNDFISSATQWVALNKTLVKSIGLLVLGITGVGIALMGVGTAATIAGGMIVVASMMAGTAISAVGAIASITGVILANLGVIGVGVGAVFAAAFSPIALVVGAITIGIIGLGIALTAGLAYIIPWGQAWEEVKRILKSFLRVAKETFEGVSNALSTGNWGLAAKIALAGLNLAFWQGMKDILISIGLMVPKMWDNFKKLFSMMVEKAWEAVKLVASILNNPLGAGLKVANFLKGMDFAGGDGIASWVNKQVDVAQASLDSLNMQAFEEKAKASAATISEQMAKRTAGIGGGPKKADDAANEVKSNSDLMGAFASLGATLGDAVGSKIKDATSVAKGALTAVADAAGGKLDGIIDKSTGSLTDGVLSALGKIGTEAYTSIGSVHAALKDLGFEAPEKWNLKADGALKVDVPSLNATVSRLATRGPNESVAQQTAKNTADTKLAVKGVEKGISAAVGVLNKIFAKPATGLSLTKVG